MNKTTNISTNQLFFLILQTQIGIGILALPYNLFKTAKTDGWISIIIASMIVQLLIVCYWWLTRRFPKKTLFEINIAILGRFIGNGLNIGYIIYYVLVSSVVTSLYVNVLKRWVYHVTPVFILVLLLAVVALYYAKEGLRNIGRFFVLVSVLLVIIVILLLSAYTTADIRYLFPIGQHGIKNIVSASKDGIIAMLGFEIILVLAPFVKAKSTTVLKVVSLSNFVVMLLYVYIIITCYLFFSPDEIPIVPEPVLYVLKASKFSFIERIDLVFLTVWIVSAITSLIMYVFICGMGMKVLFKKKTHRPFIPIIILMVVILSNYFASTDDLLVLLSEAVTTLSYFFIGVLPVFLLFVSFFRKGVTKS
ncbi:GerAB/ArcD/ProY family transporter [Metabacillus iocasae]|uniref:Spore germination protein (Amino acid permease) n=1 Tax=Priestia iocasae TaxID=2291674 RepID=A0ABS2QVV6_9BACI|nr:GerAB/ArcD/ProY family transporter [Metabacillus iocasae]MBM7703604.1 spore germination protein (amino acid permease) [Metabacillus iocasae]